MQARCETAQKATIGAVIGMFDTVAHAVSAQRARLYVNIGRTVALEVGRRGVSIRVDRERQSRKRRISGSGYGERLFAGRAARGVGAEVHDQISGAWCGRQRVVNIDERRIPVRLQRDRHVAENRAAVGPNLVIRERRALRVLTIVVAQTAEPGSRHDGAAVGTDRDSRRAEIVRRCVERHDMTRRARRIVAIEQVQRRCVVHIGRVCEQRTSVGTHCETNIVEVVRAGVDCVVDQHAARRGGLCSASRQQRSGCEKMWTNDHRNCSDRLPLYRSD